MMGRPLTTEAKSEVVRMYLEGQSAQEITDSLGIAHKTHVYAVLRREGVATRGSAWKLSTSDKEAVARRYAGGETAPDLGREYGVHPESIRQIALNRGGARQQRAHALTPAVRESLCNALRAGDLIKDAVEKAGIGYDQFVEWAEKGKATQAGEHYRRFSLEVSRAKADGKRARLAKRRVHPVDDTFFSAIDTEEKAYWLGFIAADGCVKERLLHVGLATKDRGHVELLQRTLRTTSPVTDRVIPTHMQTVNGKPVRVRETYRSHLYVSSKGLVADLIRHGITPAKTFIVEPWAGPVDLLRHYWRGAVDGDGWIGRTLSKPRRDGSCRADWIVGFCGNRKMVDGFANFVRDSLRLEPTAFGPKGSIFEVRYCGNRKAKAVASLLWDGAAVSLERKRLLARSLLAEPGCD